jgi:enamine deaminase RidA (YjgF/YER057c/UK114 family)
VDLSAVNGSVPSDAGVEHGARLVAFVEAVGGGDEERLRQARAELRQVLSVESFVDAVATVAAFNVVDRIADATGIPLDDMMRPLSADVRRELNLARFGSAANTPGGD